MNKRVGSVAAALISLSLSSACSSGANDTNTMPPKGNTVDPSGEPLPPMPAPSARTPMTADECTASGGTVVGDIGDGAIHRPDYKCPSGKPPSGKIIAAEGEPVAIEGSVCCPS